jgi:hypothetical protein
MQKIDISLGNTLTLATIIISVITFYISWNRESEFSRRNQADQVRIAAAISISKIERWKEISLSFFDEAQSVFVEASEIVVKEPNTFNIIGSRDFLWKEINRARIATKRYIINENIENAYSSLMAYYPASRIYFREVINSLNNAEDAMFEKLLKTEQGTILSFEGKKEGYQTAQMGNALRWAAADIKKEFEAQIDPIITKAVSYLSTVIDMEDTSLILQRRDIFDKQKSKGARWRGQQLNASAH